MTTFSSNLGDFHDGDGMQDHRHSADRERQVLEAVCTERGDVLVDSTSVLANIHKLLLGLAQDTRPFLYPCMILSQYTRPRPLLLLLLLLFIIIIIILVSPPPPPPPFLSFPFLSFFSTPPDVSASPFPHPLNIINNNNNNNILSPPPPPPPPPFLSFPFLSFPFLSFFSTPPDVSASPFPHPLNSHSSRISAGIFNHSDSKDSSAIAESALRECEDAMENISSCIALGDAELRGLAPPPLLPPSLGPPPKDIEAPLEIRGVRGEHRDAMVDDEQSSETGHAAVMVWDALSSPEAGWGVRGGGRMGCAVQLFVESASILPGVGGELIDASTCYALATPHVKGRDGARGGGTMQQSYRTEGGGEESFVLEGEGAGIVWREMLTIHVDEGKRCIIQVGLYGAVRDGAACLLGGASMPVIRGSPAADRCLNLKDAKGCVVATLNLRSEWPFDEEDGELDCGRGDGPVFRNSGASTYGNPVDGNSASVRWGAITGHVGGAPPPPPPVQGWFGHVTNGRNEPAQECHENGGAESTFSGAGDRRVVGEGMGRGEEEEHEGAWMAERVELMNRIHELQMLVERGEGGGDDGEEFHVA